MTLNVCSVGTQEYLLQGCDSVIKNNTVTSTLHVLSKAIRGNPVTDTEIEFIGIVSDTMTF
jgi:predicted transcriptional regulator